MKWWNRLKNKPFLIKLTQWEYWPSLAFYWPMFIYGPILALRPKHPCFFTPANPGLDAGGMCMESKFQTLSMLPDHLQPVSIYVPDGMKAEAIKVAISTKKLQFPLIVKPDIGFRGLLVRKVKSIEELVDYVNKYPIDFLIQEFLDYQEEIGVFYTRMPDEENGEIISLTLKEFLFVIGDGVQNVEALVMQKPRALLQLERLQDTHRELLDTVPAKGEKVNLGVIGNHSKGTMFINGNDLIDEKLTAVFDQLGKSVEGFYYGRFDIKCQSLEALKEGRGFKIIELNGVFSEPTHIYDPNKMSYFGALRTILKHWKLVQRISLKNYQRGISPMPVPDMLRVIKSIRDYKKLIMQYAD